LINIGIVGNRNFKDVELGFDLVENWIEKLVIVKKSYKIHSGEAKSKHKGNVDQRAKKKAIEIGLEYIPHEPRLNDNMTQKERNDEFKRRNGELAKVVKILICFINKGQWHSGTFNTINQFTKLGKWDFLIFNQWGKIWEYKDLPKWLRDRILKYHIEYPILIEDLRF